MDMAREAMFAFLLMVICLAANSVGAVDEMRWCTIDVQEEQKCVAMKNAFATQGLSPAVVCVAGNGVSDCMSKIKNGLADLVTLDGGHIYDAGKEYQLETVLQEVYETETYYAIAVVHVNSGLTIKTLEGKKSCHTGVRRTAGWNIPVGFLLEAGYMKATDCQDDINAVSRFFLQSCAPGAYTATNDPYGTNPDNLCAICTDPQCPASSSELYNGYDGAFRCLAEGAGDVAFIKPQVIIDNTDGKGNDGWNNNLRSADYRLLCPDGSTNTLENAAQCNLAKSPAHAVVTAASNPGLADFQAVMQQAVDLFGADDNQLGFKLFDSTAYGGSDLLFKDATLSLKNLGNGQDYRTYLGSYANTIDGLRSCPPDTLRWCTISNDETQKCRDMSDAFLTQGLTPEISCYQESSRGLCIDRIAAGDADVVTLDGGDMYTGGKENKIAPVLGENYQDSSADADASYWAVAVARKGTQFGIDDLQQRQSCHTGISKTSGWNVPVGHLIKTGHISVDGGCDVPEAVGEFFSGGSCAPGAKDPKYDPSGTNPNSLCQQCIGDGDSHCVRNSAEPYYNYAGAFRCLAERAGDVAFVKHTTVSENTDGNGSEPWSQPLRSQDYELLCVDNQRKEIGDWASCNLAKVPSHAVVTALTKTSAERAVIRDLLLNAQNTFGSDEGSGFKMFDSAAYGGSDLLFKDSTQSLIDVGDKDTYEEWLSDEYLDDLDALYCDYTGAAPSSATSSLWALTFALFLQGLWVRLLASE